MSNILCFIFNRMKSNYKKILKRSIVTLAVIFYLYIYLVFSTSEFVGECGDFADDLNTSGKMDIAKKYSTLIANGNERLWLLEKIGCK